MSSINFDNPYLLLIAIPLIALFAVPFAIAVRKDNVNAHNVAAGVLHIIMSLLIAFAAAGTSIVTTITETDVYVLADVSYSASRNLDTVDGYISDLKSSLPDNTRMGVICFAKDYQLITRLGERLKSVKTAEVDDSSTDILGALDFAGSLFRDDVIKRIVVITDGRQTADASDSNALKRQVDALADRKIHVDAIYLDDNIKGDEAEVQLSEANFTDTVSIGGEQTVTFNIQCNCAEEEELEAIFSLKKDGEEIARRTLYLTKGNNSESFTLDTTVSGTFDYVGEITAESDVNLNNNKLTFSQTVSGSRNVLLITRTDADFRAVRDLCGEDVVLDAYVTSTFGYSVPCSVEDLCAYDEIILSDIDVTKLNNSEMFLSSLDTAVSLFGKSLITFGNTYVQSYAGGELKILSDMLPVVYGKSMDDPKLYTLVVDTSRSMDYYDKLTHAKAAATEIVNLLAEDDMVALVEFNGDAFTLHNPVPVSTDREAVLQTIKNLSVRQGTVIGSGLTAAFNLMKAGRYSEKRVMLFTDGLNFPADAVAAAELERLVSEMRDYSIYTSVLDVGRGSSSSTAASTAATALLNNIVLKGGGTYLDISSDEKLENVINTQLPADVNTVNGGISKINVKRRSDEALSGIAESEWANAFVLDYYYSAAKSNASTVLSLNFSKSANTVMEPPLYSYWNYGNGKTATFSSTISGDWVSYIGEELRGKFFSNVLKTNVPSAMVNYPFLFDVDVSEGYADVTLTPATVRADAQTEITITAPDGKTVSGSLAFGSSTFTYSFVTPDVGKYVVDVTYSYGGKTYTAQKIINLSYSAEYDSFALYDAAPLHKMVGAHGTVSEDGKLKITVDDSEVGRYNLPLAMPLLIACVVLYAVDIAVRKLKWEDIRSLFKRVRK